MLLISVETEAKDRNIEAGVEARGEMMMGKIKARIHV